MGTPPPHLASHSSPGITKFWKLKWQRFKHIFIKTPHPKIKKIINTSVLITFYSKPCIVPLDFWKFWLGGDPTVFLGIKKSKKFAHFY